MNDLYIREEGIIHKTFFNDIYQQQIGYFTVCCQFDERRKYYEKNKDSVSTKTCDRLS